MPGDETLKPTHDESESEEEETEADVIPKVDIDPSALTPLSPEVISKQVRIRVTISHAQRSHIRSDRQRLI